jgi:hypothetical protein
VIGVPDESWGESVKALVVLRPGEASETELIEHCRSRLAHFKARSRSRSGTSSPDGDRQAPEVQAPGALLGGHGPPVN